jgi:biopolymer transport protein ExbD
MTPAMMFLIAAVALLLAVGIYELTKSHRKAKQEEHIGRLGVESKFTLDREAGLNLPYADQAAVPPGPAELTVEIPIEWGKDMKLAGDELAKRFDAITSKLTPDGAIYNETITLRIDRDIEYRLLVQAVTMGREKGFNKYQVACRKRGGSSETGCLVIDLPTDPPMGRLLWRLVREGDTTLHVFGERQPKTLRTLAEATGSLKATTKDPSKVLVLMPSPEISVQNVMEALNSATWAGFTKVTLARMNVE